MISSLHRFSDLKLKTSYSSHKELHCGHHHLYHRFESDNPPLDLPDSNLVYQLAKVYCLLNQMQSYFEFDEEDIWYRLHLPTEPLTTPFFHHYLNRQHTSWDVFLPLKYQ